MDQTTGDEDAEACSAATEFPAERMSMMALRDRQGGWLALDLTCPDLRWLAAACRSLLAGNVPPGATRSGPHQARADVWALRNPLVQTGVLYRAVAVAGADSWHLAPSVAPNAS